MKKSLFFLILTGIVAGTLFWWFKPKKEEEVILEPKIMDFVIKSPKEMRNQKTAPEKEKKALEESLHEGVAFFADLYRLELAIYPERNHCLYVLFIDNYLAKPIFPRGTDLSLKIGNDTIPIAPAQNGVVMNGGKCVQLPATIEIEGLLRGKFFKHSVEIKTYRKNPVFPPKK